MKIKHLFVSLSILFFISACTKISETEIGTGLIPAIDGVVTKDTVIYLDAKNSGIDTISPSLYDDHALGYINDPLFGTTTASINVQIQPLTKPFLFEVSNTPDSLMLDSVVLALDVQGVWGDTTQLLSLHVKELDNNQTFIADSSLIIYNTESEFTATQDLTYNGAALIDPRMLNDSVKVFGDTTANMLRIRLTDDFGNRLLHTYDTTNAYKSDSAFRANFKGFQITPDMVGNSLIRVGLASSSTYAAEPNTKLALYYRYKSPTVADSIITAVKYLTVTTSSAHSNHIKRNLDAGLAGNYYPPVPDSSNDDFIYIQASPGTYATLRLDSAAINNLPNIIVHRAEILMEEAPADGYNIFDELASPFLFLLAKENDTSRFNIPGFYPQSASTADAVFSSGTLSNYAQFGGVPFLKTNTENKIVTYYSFNITRYLQGVVTNNNPQYSFILYTPYKEAFRLVQGVESYGRVAATPYNNAGIGRIRLYGGSKDISNTRRMRLHLVYSVPH